MTRSPRATTLIWQLVHEKNAFLMNPLQLAVVDEAAGNGDVVRLLVQAGADINAPCWDITPLCAAANGGHHWRWSHWLGLGVTVFVERLGGALSRPGT